MLAPKVRPAVLCCDLLSIYVLLVAAVTARPTTQSHWFLRSLSTLFYAASLTHK